MIKEKFISYISKYLLVTALIMMLGLINEDRGLRGLPFAWLWAFGFKQVIVPRFIMSFVCIFIVVVLADIIAKVIIRVREPSLKTLTKEVRTQERAKAASIETSLEISPEDSIEISYVEPAPEEAEEFEELNILQREDVPVPKLKESVKKTSSKAKGNASNIGGLILGIILSIIAVAIPFFATLNTNNGFDDVFPDDGQFYFVTDDVTYYGTEKEEYIDHTKMALQDLFDNMVYENSPLGEFTNEEETQALLDLCVWENMEVQLMEIDIDEEKGTSISRFVIADAYGNHYLAAVLMDIERTEVEDWDEDEGYIECETNVRGMAVLPGDGDTFISEIAQIGESILTDEDIKDAVNLGETTYEGVNILLHRPDTGNLHLEAEENQAA